MRNWPMRQIDLAHVVGDHLGSDMLGLFLHLLHQPGALDDVGETGIVFHLSRDRQLAAGLDALDQGRFQHGASGIDRRRVAGRPRTDDDDLGVGDLAHREKTLCALAGARSTQWQPIDAVGLGRWRHVSCWTRSQSSNAASGGLPPPPVPKAFAEWQGGPEALVALPQSMGSGELCKICRPECHRVVKAVEVAWYHSAQ
jgi:hypothetical protein